MSVALATDYERIEWRLAEWCDEKDELDVEMTAEYDGFLGVYEEKRSHDLSGFVWSVRSDREIESAGVEKTPDLARKVCEGALRRASIRKNTLPR